jgi:hypothetical protein
MNYPGMISVGNNITAGQLKTAWNVVNTGLTVLNFPQAIEGAVDTLNKINNWAGDTYGWDHSTNYYAQAINQAAPDTCGMGPL